MKKYRLLQDYRTPSISVDKGNVVCKKGDTYEYEFVSRFGNGFIAKFTAVTVENTPDWFEEVKEPERDVYDEIVKLLNTVYHDGLAKMLREKYLILKRDGSFGATCHFTLSADDLT